MTDQASRSVRVPEVEPSELFAFKECQDLFRRCLTEPMLGLIAQLTGLRLHVLWHHPLDFQGPGEIPVLCPRARQQAGAHGGRPNLDTRCRGCLQRRWKLALSLANQGRRFVGPCGATNFCACLQVDNVCPLTLVLQARVAPRSFPGSHELGQGENISDREKISRLQRSSRAVGRGRNIPFSAGHVGEPVSLAAFDHAVALARLILHDLESTARARIARGGLDNALRRLNNTRTEATRLRGELRHRLPDLPESAVQPPVGSHAQKIVDAMLNYVHQHYLRPISLGDLASAMNMNACYLSTLFSQTTGVTFHQFLEEIRLAKARELLRDPRNRVGEVAGAAGYASPDAFRHAFKAHEGLSPEAWRAGK